jgi:hypothetical protein
MAHVIIVILVSCLAVAGFAAVIRISLPIKHKHKLKIKSYNDWLVLAREDKQKAEDWLYNYADKCKSRNTNCLHEVFCTECPMGLLKVVPYRSGL